MSTRADKLSDALRTGFGDSLELETGRTGDVTASVAAADLVDTCMRLRDDPALAFSQLIDLCGVDYLAYGRDEWTGSESTGTGFSRGVSRYADAAWHDEPVLPGRRFAVVSHLLSITHNRRLRLRCWCVDDAVPMVPTLTMVWPSANWFEREAFDLFGILFDGHPDLRRILTDYGFIGHPFRKDFPLTGNVEVRYDPERQRVVYQPVSITPRTLVPRVIRHDNRYQPGMDEGGRDA